ncbi:hypothetical protein [Azospirillum himalayense]|uniref:Uncharacterized protein n=1 Tax=Azospirillum himalayense TaxID=654847 RepID=A0ABW0GC83_9PROT
MMDERTVMQEALFYEFSLERQAGFNGAPTCDRLMLKLACRREFRPQFTDARMDGIHLTASGLRSRGNFPFHHTAKRGCWRRAPLLEPAEPMSCCTSDGLVALVPLYGFQIPRAAPQGCQTLRSEITGEHRVMRNIAHASAQPPRGQRHRGHVGGINQELNRLVIVQRQDDAGGYAGLMQRFQPGDDPLENHPAPLP